MEKKKEQPVSEVNMVKKSPRDEVLMASGRLRTRLINELTDAIQEFHEKTGLYVKDMRVMLLPAGPIGAPTSTIVSDIDIEVGIG